MKGTAFRLINDYINQKARGNKAIESTLRTKFILNGINVININDKTKDDPDVIFKIQQVIRANP